MLGWVKVVVGALIQLAFTLPLVTVWKYQRLRDEPMAVLVANMSGFDLLFGVLLTLVGALELVLDSMPVCSALQYLVVAAAGAVKVATFSLAVDQYTAVTSPLKYYLLMERRLRWLLAAGWLMLVQLVAQGAAFYAVGAPSWAQIAAADAANGNATDTGNRIGAGNDSAAPVDQFPGCRWEKAVSNTYILLFEGQLLAASLATSALFLYTALVGWSQSRDIRRSRNRGVQNSPENDRFFANFKAFKLILKLVSLSLLMDVTTPVFRLYQRWHPMPTVAGVLHVLRLGCTILEGSTYGLMNRSLRLAYRDLLGLRSRAVSAHH